MVDLAAVHAKLAQAGQKHFWQSLEELSETKEYREFLEHEFPHETAKNPEGIDRRDVLKLAAASAALAALRRSMKTVPPSAASRPSNGQRRTSILETKTQGTAAP